MATDFVLLAVGIGLLLAGGRAFVAGATQLASALGVSESTIGLTVVAFGTSAPELAVNTLAALRGDAAIAFGNVVGSNIANVGLVLGVCALVQPLRIGSRIVSREIPMMMLASAAAVVLGLDRYRGTIESYDRSDGVILLILFGLFLYYSASEVIGKRNEDPLAEAAATRVGSGVSWMDRRAGALAIVGLGTLLVGAQLTIIHAVSLAEALAVPRAVIGLTIVAVGTSLPELTTSLVATWKGQTSLAVGNVVGSNIFNLLFILGSTALIQPVELPETGGAADLAALALFSVILLRPFRSRGLRIRAWEGGGLLVAYFGFVTWRLFG